MSRASRLADFKWRKRSFNQRWKNSTRSNQSQSYDEHSRIRKAMDSINYAAGSENVTSYTQGVDNLRQLATAHLNNEETIVFQKARSVLRCFTREREQNIINRRLIASFTHPKDLALIRRKIRSIAGEFT